MTGVRGRRRWLAVVASVAALALAAAGVWHAREDLLGTSTRSVRAAYDRGDWTGAAALATERLKREPNDRDALRLLARASARRGRDEAARNLYARLGGTTAMAGEDFFLLGQVIDRTGDHQGARACWVAGLQNDPKNPELLNEFVRLYLDGNQLELAERTAATLAGQPGWEVRGALALGQVALRRDAPATAARRFEQALERDPALRGAPEPPPFYANLLARALLRAGRPDEAARQLRRTPTGMSAERAWLLDRAALQAGRWSRAAPESGRAEAYRAEHPLEPEPAPYIGSQRCEECHPRQYKAEQRSLHARTFERWPTAATVPVPERPQPDRFDPGVAHTIAARDGRLRFATTDKDATLAAVVEYAFGSGHRGVTLVGRDDAGRMRELRLSHYSDGPSWDVTTGHPKIPPADEGFLGRFLSAADLDSCFDCHTTAPGAAQRNEGPTAADRGIGCERCHGPGGNHLQAVKAKRSDRAIVEPRDGAGAGVVGLCGQCHSPRRRAVGPKDPLAPRFPAAGLTWSRCYTESPGAFDCSTCHDPHRDLATDPAHYENACRSCHAPEAGHAVCPVNARAGCVGCHMPKTDIGVPHSRFTDHFIRVHRGKDGD